jgi:nicotinamidase-related amidase
MAKSILLIVDMISPYDFPDSDRLAEGALGVVERIAGCRSRADDASIPVAYANDINDGFSGDREAIVGKALAGERPELVKPILPRSSDAFLHKGRHSAFYGTPLAHLLEEWEVEEVVLAGQVNEQCILYTAFDAHIRDYEITVLRDCVLGIDDELSAAALRMMETNMGARILDADQWPG